MTARPRRLAVPQTLVQRLGQDRMRPEFQEQVEARAMQGIGRRGELNRFTEVAAPVVGVKLGRRRCTVPVTVE